MLTEHQPMTEGPTETDPPAMVVVNARMLPSERDRLRAMADASGITLSELLRSAVRMAFGQHPSLSEDGS